MGEGNVFTGMCLSTLEVYLKYWMGDQGIPLIEKWESTGKLDYSNSRETPATEGGRRKALSSGYKLQTYWDLLDEEFKPKGNKLLSIIELWTRSKQGDKPLNQWLTQIYNLVNICKYPEDSTDRIIRDVLIVGCNSNHVILTLIKVCMPGPRSLPGVGYA